MRSISLFSSIDDVDSAHGKEAGDEVLRVEGFAQAETGGEGTYYGDEGVEDGYLAYGVAADELVVEGEAEGRDADEQCQDDEAVDGDVGEGALHEQAGDDEQEPAEEEAVAGAYEDIDTARETARQEAGKGRAEGIEHDHAIAQEGELSATALADIKDEDTRDADAAAENLPWGKAVALEEDASQDNNQEYAQRVDDGCPRSLAM